MRGTMNVESKEGTSSTFWFTIFARRVERPSHRPSGKKMPSMALSERVNDARVLLVEDNPVNRMVGLQELIGLTADIASEAPKQSQRWNNDRTIFC